MRGHPERILKEKMKTPKANGRLKSGLAPSVFLGGNENTYSKWAFKTRGRPNRIINGGGTPIVNGRAK